MSTKKGKVYYKKADDYQAGKPVSGCWGGITAHGLICVEFYLERLTPPPSLIILPDGKLAEEGQGKIVRTRQVELVMSPITAYSIGEWLIEKAQQAGVEKLEESGYGLQ